MALRRRLTPSERDLYDAAAAGEVLSLTDAASEDRIIGGDVIHDLCVDHAGVHSKGVRLVGAVITGPLDFEHATLRVPLHLESCGIRRPHPRPRGTVDADPPEPDAHDPALLAIAETIVNLDHATAPAVSFLDCGPTGECEGVRIEGSITAEQLRTTHSFDLSGSEVEGMVQLDSATIGGSVKLRRTTVHGSVLMRRANITAALDLRGARLRRGTGFGQGPMGMFDGTGIKVGGGVELGRMRDARMRDRLAGERLPKEISGEMEDDRPFECVGDAIFEQARLDRQLSLEGAEVGGSLNLTDASISSIVNLGGVRIGVAVTDEAAKGIQATRVTIKGSLLIEVIDWFTKETPDGWRDAQCRGPVCLKDAQISGAVEFSQVDIRGDLDLTGASIDSEANFWCVRLSSYGDTPDRVPRNNLIARSLRVKGDVSFHGPESLAPLSPDGRMASTVEALITGRIDFYSATVGGNLMIQNTAVGLGNTEAASEAIDLRTASIGNHLGLLGSVLFRPGQHDADEPPDDRWAILASGVRVGASLHLHAPARPPFDRPQVLAVGGSIDLTGAKVGQNARLEEVEVDGILQVSNASIGADLTLHGTHLRRGVDHDPAIPDAGQDSLRADRLHVGGDLLFEGPAEQEPFRSRSGVVLRGARIDGRLDLRDVSPSNKAGESDVARHGTSMSRLDLRECRCGRFSAPDGEPLDEGIRLQGFQFDSLHEGMGRRKQVAWIRQQKQGTVWSPDPYEQLASFYRGTGRELSARQVMIAKNKDEIAYSKAVSVRRAEARKTSKRNGEKVPSARKHLLEATGGRWYRSWRRAFWITLGFGYRRAAAGLGILLLALAATVAFAHFHDEGAMVPTYRTAAGQSMPACGQEYPCFNPLVYGLDVVLPIIDFGQETAWRPDTRVPGGDAAQGFRWVFIALGWAATTLFVAAFTVLIKKD